jgi:psiF repeat
VRDSARIIGLLDAKTEKAKRGERIEKHLLLTRYDAARAARGEMLTIEDVLQLLSIPLLGIIPESEEVLRASNLGSLITINNSWSAPAHAYVDAARRLKGEAVEMTIPSDRKGLFNKLLGRRASQRERMKTGNTEAGAKNLAARRTFMLDRLSGQTEAGPAVNSQQQKMKDCNAKAGELKLTGDARRTFMSSCLKAT